MEIKNCFLQSRNGNLRNSIVYGMTMALLFVCSQALSQDPFTDVNIKSSPADSVEFFLQKGLLEKQNRRSLVALKYFEQALKYDTNNKIIISEIAAAYYDLRKYNMALAWYKKLETMGDPSPELYKKLLTLSYQLKQNEDVLLFVNKLKKLNPAEKVAFYIGHVHYENDNYGEAIKYLNQAEQEDPQNAEIYYLIARCYTNMANYKLAIPYFKKAIELKPDNGNWIYELSLAYYGMRHYRDALRYMLEAGDKGLKKDINYFENLSIAYLSVGELEKGIAILNDILKRKPADIDILHMIAEAYYEKARYDTAIKYWDQVLQYDKENASALYMIGMCYQKMGGKENMQKGIRLCNKAIEMDPSLENRRQKKITIGL